MGISWAILLTDRTGFLLNLIRSLLLFELFDANRAQIDPILKDVYGAEAGVWRRRWRMFFLATAESFGFKDGDAWGVNHYLLKPSS